MKELFNDIKKQYGDSFQLYGDSPKSLLTPKGRNFLRFSAIDEFVTKKGTTVLDYGCGLGFLCDYLNRSFDINYSGVDIMPEFIDTCISKFPDSEFHLVDPKEELSGSYDVVFASGVFNIQSHKEINDSKNYAFTKIQELYELSNQVLICDFLSSFVDFKQSGAQHFSPEELSEFCYKNFGQKFVIRHDILPYEVTLIVWKNQDIKRPDNIWCSDL